MTTIKAKKDLYNMGKRFNLGRYPEEEMQKCTGIEFTDENLPVYETGATSHSVNDLILFTDNTRELAALRDRIYMDWAQNGKKYPQIDRFNILFNAAKRAYRIELPTGCGHIVRMTAKDVQEFNTLYVRDFEAWKEDHEINA